MEIAYFLIPASLLLALSALGAFIWSVKRGQFDDLETPAKKILFEDSQTNDSKDIDQK